MDKDFFKELKEVTKAEEAALESEITKRLAQLEHASKAYTELREQPGYRDFLRTPIVEEIFLLSQDLYLRSLKQLADLTKKNKLGIQLLNLLESNTDPSGKNQND